MSLSELKRIEPFVAISFALFAVSFLLLTSEEVELGRAVSQIGFFFLILGIASIFLERVLYGEIQTDPGGS